MKIYFLALFTLTLSLKIINKKYLIKEEIIKIIMINIVITIFYVPIKNLTGFFYSTVFLILAVSIFFGVITKNNAGFSILTTIISLSINYILFLIAISISFIPNMLFKITNNIIGVSIILINYINLVYYFNKIKRFKNGLAFLQKNMQNEYLNLLILQISVIILFCVIIISDYKADSSYKVIFSVMILAIIMFITIQKSLQLYYKQKQLIKTLEETQAELEEIKKDNKQLEQENIEISKRSHSLVHKQKSLEYKLNELIAKTEESKQIKQQENSTKGTSKIKTITEQETEIKSRLENISKEIYTEKATIELDKTEIENIDDMLKYQQAECIKNKIEFELQIKGNIHYMVNNLISKEDLEILIADHIKDAIIAINHSENENRNILLRIGKIDENYGIYIYDSGIEFEKETLENYDSFMIMS